MWQYLLTFPTNIFHHFWRGFIRQISSTNQSCTKGNFWPPSYSSLTSECHHSLKSPYQGSFPCPLTFRRRAKDQPPRFLSPPHCTRSQSIFPTEGHTNFLSRFIRPFSLLSTTPQLSARVYPSSTRVFFNWTVKIYSKGELSYVWILQRLTSLKKGTPGALI